MGSCRSKREVGEKGGGIREREGKKIEIHDAMWEKRIFATSRRKKKLRTYVHICYALKQEASEHSVHTKPRVCWHRRGHVDRTKKRKDNPKKDSSPITFLLL